MKGVNELPENSIRHSSAPELALAARREIIMMTSAAKASHVGSALSVVDILSILYTGGARITPETLEEADRDIVILSKGHAAAALYSVLGLQGFFPIEWLKQYCQNDAPLGGHITSNGVPGVELSPARLATDYPMALELHWHESYLESRGVCL